MNSINSKYILAVLSTSVGSGFQHGYHSGVISLAHRDIRAWIAQNKKERTKKMPSEKELTFIWTLVLAMFNIGGMLGSLMTAYFANRFGNKGGLIWNNCIMFLAAIFLYFAKYSELFEIFILGRFVIGINAGLNSGLCPMYLADIAPVSLRGSTTALYSFVMMAAIFVAQFFSLEKTLGDEHHWPLIFGLTAIPAGIQLGVLLFCPESPRFLMVNLDDEDRARQSLIWYRNTKDVLLEFNMLKEHKKILAELPKASFKSLFSEGVYRNPLIIAMTLVVSQQCCGFEAAFHYSSELLEDAGLSPDEAQSSILIMSVLMVVGTGLCVSLIDAIGRRLLFLISFCGVLLDTILVAIVLMLAKDDVVRDYIKWLAAFAVVAFAGWYALGVATVPMVMTVELFNTLARPYACSVIVPLSWFSSFLVSATYLPMMEAIGFYVFGIYIVLDLLFFMFINMYLPDTMGKTTKQIIKSFHRLETEHKLRSLTSLY